MIVLSSNTKNQTLTATIRIQRDEFLHALQEAYIANTDKIVLPGYAAGLAPREAIEQYYGETALFDEALDLCVPKLYSEYLQENRLRTVGRPQLTEVTWLSGGGAKFTVVCDLFPAVKLGTYKGVKVPASRKNADEFAAKALVAACTEVQADVPQVMIQQKLGAMLAGKKMQIGRDAIYHVLADFTAVLEQAYRETGVCRPQAQVRAQALDVMLQTVSGDNAQLSPSKFRALIKELVEHYRAIPDDFDATIDRLLEERGKSKRAMDDGQKIDEAFDAYLGSINQTLEMWRENNAEKAKDAARFDLLLSAVAEAEGLAVSETEMTALYARIAQESGCSLAEVAAQVQPQPLREQLLRDKAMRLIVENAKEVEA